MIVIPAIDLYDGKVVRLREGKLSTMEVYSHQPLAVALSFKEAKIKYLHIVDLNGAIEGKIKNLGIVEEIKRRTSMCIEFGGGIRSYSTFIKVLNIGVDYLILSTKILSSKKKTFISKLKDYKQKIIISLDILNRDSLAIAGWLDSLNVSIFDVLKEIKELGITNVIVTDVKKDGTLAENIDYDLLYNIKKFSYDLKLTLTYAGGISNLSQIINLKNIGIDRVIVGKALYTNRVKLEELARLTTD